MEIYLAQIFEEHFKTVKFDREMVKRFTKYQIGYINQNSQHLQFFGSNLLGVHTVRFKDTDVLRMFNDVLDVDYYTLTDDIRTVTTIDHDFKISGDVFNLTCMYCIHKFLTSPLLNDKERNTGAFNAAMIFFFRCTAAILSNWIRYPFDEKIAQMAYSALSNKYLIKKLGNWYKVMEYRSNDLIGKESIHKQNLLRFNNDPGIVYALNDSQGRIKDLIKNYYAELKKAHTEGESLGVTKGTLINAEGEETFKEKTHSTESYISYLRQIVVDENSFIKNDLVTVISKINTNTSFKMLRNTLSWLSEQYSLPKFHKQIDEFITLIVVQTFHLLDTNIPASRKRDYPYILNTLKNLYLSTRSIDPELEKIRSLGEKLVKEHAGSISKSLMMATRTSVILYVSLRVMAGK